MTGHSWLSHLAPSRFDNYQSTAKECLRDCANDCLTTAQRLAVINKGLNIAHKSILIANFDSNPAKVEANRGTMGEWVSTVSNSFTEVEASDLREHTGSIVVHSLNNHYAVAGSRSKDCVISNRRLPVACADELPVG